MVWLYPQVVKQVRDSASQLLNSEIMAQDFQKILLNAENQIEALEEKWLRALFFDIENGIEEILYTVSESEQREKLCKLVDGMLRIIVNYEKAFVEQATKEQGCVRIE